MSHIIILVKNWKKLEDAIEEDHFLSNGILIIRSRDISLIMEEEDKCNKLAINDPSCAKFYRDQILLPQKKI